MGRAFTLLSNCLVALRKSATPESVPELLHLIHLPYALICSVCSPRNLIAERRWDAVQLRLRARVVRIAGVTAPP